MWSFILNLKVKDEPLLGETKKQPSASVNPLNHSMKSQDIFNEDFPAHPAGN